MSTIWRIRMTLLACTFLMPPALARAAEATVSPPSAAAEQSGGPTLQEIVVTATRREENLQKVPVAVTALTSTQMADQQINEPTDLQRAVPNIQVTNYGGRPDNTRIGIRGPYDVDAIISLDNPVGLYLDGVYISRNSGSNLDFLDVNRVEVLRGPQGTLFGRNTIGGAVSIITNQPTNSFEGWLEAGYGNHDAWKIRGVINAPINDSTAVRVAVSHSEHDGYWRSTFSGQKIGDDHDTFGRVSVTHDFGPHWRLYLSADASYDYNNGINQALTGMLPIFGGFDYVQVTTGFQQSGADFIHPYSYDHTTHPQHVTSKTLGLNATVTGDLGAGTTFKSITGYRTGWELALADSVDCQACGGVYDLGHRGSDEFSQELQLLGKSFDSRLDWIVGAYYFTEEGYEYDRYVVLYPAFLQTFGATNGSGKNNSVGVYAQATYKVTDMVSLTAGVRYTHDERSIISRNFFWNAGPGPQPNFDSPATGCELTGATLANDCDVPSPVKSFNYLPWTVGVNFTPIQDVLLYAKYSKGYRAGGFNLRGVTPAAINAFNPESLGSWEVGEKAELLGHHLRLNADFYYDFYTQIQLSAIINAANGQPTNVISNAGDAHIYGVEAEATVVLGNLTVNGSIGTADAKYTHLDPGTGLTTAQPFPSTPKVTAYLGGDYIVQTSLGNVDFHLDGAYRGSSFWGTGPTGTPAIPSLTMHPYWLMSGVATIKFAKSGVDVSVWGKNLTDTHYLVQIDDITSAGYTSGQVGDPRTFGFTVTKHF